MDVSGGPTPGVRTVKHVLLALLRTGRQLPTLVCLAAACALFIVSGAVLESGVVARAAPDRLAAADLVVGGASEVTVHGSERSESVPLPAPAPIGPRTVALTESWARAHRARVIADHISPGAVGHRLDLPVRVHNWGATRLGSGRLESGGTAPGPTEVVLEASLAAELGARTGEAVALRTATGARTYRLSGILATPHTDDDVTPNSRQRAVYLDERTARALATSDAPTHLGIVADGTEGAEEAKGEELSEAADSLRARLDGLPVTVAGGDGRGLVEHPEISATRTDLQTLGGSLIALVVLVTVVVVASTMTAALEARRRQLALLRALAVTPQGLLKALSAETSLSCAGAAVVGVPLGLIAVSALQGVLGAAGLLPAGFGLTAGPVTVLGAVLLTACLGTFLSWATARRLAKAAPAGTLAARPGDAYAVRGATLVWGWALVLLGSAACVLPVFWQGLVAVAIAGGGGLLLTFGAVLAGRPVLASLVRATSRPPRSPGTWLARALVAGSAPRIAASVAPLVLVLALALIQVAVPATLASAAERGARTALRGGHALTSAAGIPLTGTPPDALPVVRQQVSGWSEVLGGPEDFVFTAVGFARPPADRLRLTVDAGRWDPRAPLEPGTAVIGRFTAATLGAGPGERIRLVLADGTSVRPTVVAVHSAGYGVADVVLPYAELAGHRPTGAPGGDAADFVLTGGPAAAADGVRAVPAAAPFAGEESTDQAVAVSVLPLLALFCYLGISVSNSLAQSMSSRRTDFGTLHRLGVTKAQLRATLHAEARLLVALAVGAGTLVAALPLTMIAWGVTGSPLPAVPLWFYVTAATGTALLATTATLLPARMLLRTTGRSHGRRDG
ncbi:ABC transporter permease [Streptomyces niveus]|uniref:ABC transporter permease n=1 Tax=Streptomyces niveus TaxID=193462 RepID=UPI0036A50563